jgi:signal transduction histidine kinase/chemotaxis methyl-accepting protein methylase
MMELDQVGSNGRPPDHSLLATLETILAPSLFARKLANDTIRVWIVGCATGEVAYVVASALYAYALRRDNRLAIRVFATDSDAGAIATARLGYYPRQLASSIPPEWLRCFVHDDEHGYRVNKIVRGLITFAQHQLLEDPPLARLDLIVCWSTLADLALDERKQALLTLHWSLRPGGYLVLNPQSERSYPSELFVTYAGAAGVFQRDSTTTLSALPYQRAPAEPPSESESLRVVNQHLQTMNQALRRKVHELMQANNDLNNLLSATDLATIFLDQALQITRFTPQAQVLFNLIPADHGRPLAHITHTLNYDRLVDDAAEVLATLQGIEREVPSANGCWYLVRLRPYRTAEERIDGVVLICVDITARLLAEAEVRHMRDELDLRVRERTRELRAANTLLEAEIAERTRLEQERTELLRKLVLTEEEERRRIARELHDQLGQSVSALGIGLGMLTNPALDPARYQQSLAHLQQIATQIEVDMKRLAIELRPSVLDDLGLIEAIQHHVERWAEDTGIQAEFQAIVPQGGRLPRELESVIYRVIQEALTNVLKHAHASDVSVILEQRRDHVQVIVEDDGRGFDLDALQRAPNVRRLGLLGMRERLALVGGTATIETAPGSGTTLFVQLPIPQQASEKYADT